MPKILAISTKAWELTVWTRDVSGPQKLLKSTRKRREVAAEFTSALRLSPALATQSLTINGESVLLSATLPDTLHEVPLNQALFFENRDYEFDFLFHESQRPEPRVLHRLQAVEDAFHVSGKSLRGTINFGNDVGWFKLRLAYQRGDRTVEQSISLEVLPTKMDMASDLNVIHQVIDEQYPLWRFALAQTTEQELATSRKPHQRFPLLWLAMFQNLRKALQSAVNTILDAPHSRLVPHKMHLRAERMKGRISARLEHAVSEKLANGELNRRYAVTRRNLTNDTPENRFVKMVLVRSGRTLGQMANRLRRGDKAPDKQRLSETFFNELGQWQHDLGRLAGRAFFADVGQFAGLSRESLVLHGRAGYSGVYRIWQQLKLYLDVFGSQVGVSLKSVEELYEVWCFLELRRILIEELGFAETESTKVALSEKQMELQMLDGFGAAFQLDRRDGLKIRLAHEPTFGKPPPAKSAGPLYSWITVQRPDILLEATFSTGEKLYWVFDAKYRIQPDNSGAEPADTVDLVPNDAINQMHRYRDALIQLHKPEGRQEQKTRPILGAFALYPGWFDQSEEENPYAAAIDEVGIGAFPLVPISAENSPPNLRNKWLRDFLTEKLGNAPVDDNPKNASADRRFTDHPPRIASIGMKTEHFDDLTLLVTGAPQWTRTDTYLTAFETGQAKSFHMKLLASERLNVEQTVMSEIRHCAITFWREEIGRRAAEFVYAVTSVQLVKRHEISPEESGLPDGMVEDRDEAYWLFKLGPARKLKEPILHALEAQHFMKLTSLEALDSGKPWDLLPDRYAFIRAAADS